MTPLHSTTPFRCCSNQGTKPEVIFLKGKEIATSKYCCTIASCIQVAIAVGSAVRLINIFIGSVQGFSCLGVSAAAWGGGEGFTRRPIAIGTRALPVLCPRRKKCGSGSTGVTRRLVLREYTVLEDVESMGCRDDSQSFAAVT